MQLVDEAFQRWLVEEEGVVDDITAVVVKFEFEDWVTWFCSGIVMHNCLWKDAWNCEIRFLNTTHFKLLLSQLTAPSHAWKCLQSPEDWADAAGQYFMSLPFLVFSLCYFFLRGYSISELSNTLDRLFLPMPGTYALASWQRWTRKERIYGSLILRLVSTL